MNTIQALDLPLSLLLDINVEVNRYHKEVAEAIKRGPTK